MRMSPEKGGFTLIEVLTVIGIIAILAAILFPVFASAREKARQASCITNLHAIAQAVTMYRRDHRRYPLTIMDLRPDYITDPNVLLCPDDVGAQAAGDVSYGYFWNLYGYFGNGDPKTAADVPAPMPSRYPALCNRNAPDNTIITRCPWHRKVGADHLAHPNMWREAGWTSSSDNTNAKSYDIVVRLDGSAKKLILGSYDWENQPE